MVGPRISMARGLALFLLLAFALAAAPAPVSASATASWIPARAASPAPTGGGHVDEPPVPPLAASGISLDHLNFLKGTIETPAGSLPIWYVYADLSAAGYRPVGAAGEGVSCVDDVARALIVYLEHYELTGDRASLEHARDAIAFLAYMRQDDGTYANFVHADGSLNLTGPTSRPGVNWWMARAMWGLAKAYRVFEAVDADQAASIAALLAPSVQRLVNEVRARQRPGAAPQPVIAGGGADVSAIFLMALSLLEPGFPDREIQGALHETAAALALGLRAYQAGDAATPPYRAVAPDPGSPAVWTGWGSHGMEALALAARAFDEPEWLLWAAEIAHALATYLAAGPGALAAQGPAPILFPQIAYDQSPLVRGLALLHEATGNPLYSDLALLAASWLFGNNPAGERVHHLPSGRTYDGIDGEAWGVPGRVNYNAGAESTIEGLSILLTLARLRPNGLLRTAELERPVGLGPVVIEAESYRAPVFGRVDSQRARGLAGSRPSGERYVVMHDGSEASYALHGARASGDLTTAYRVDVVHGGARGRPATLYVVAGDEVVGAVAIGQDARGDRLRMTRVGLLELARDAREASQITLRLVVEGGPVAVDAVTLHPAVMWRRVQGPSGAVIAARNVTGTPEPFSLAGVFTAPGARPSAGAQGAPALYRAVVYDQDGQRVADVGDASTVVIPPFGFALVVETPAPL